MNDGDIRAHFVGISGGRKDSNNDILCKIALAAAQERGATTEFIALRSLSIQDCKGCFACGKSLAAGEVSRCVLKDDYDWLREKMLNADGIIFSLPVFRLGAPAPFFRLIERMGIRDDIGTYRIRQMEGKALADERMLKARPLVFFGTAGTDLSCRFAADCRLFSTVSAWPIAALELFSWTRNVLIEPEKLDRAAWAGRHLAEAAASGICREREETRGVCPGCGSDCLKLDRNSTGVECCACGLQGRLRIEDDAFFFMRDPENPSRHAFNTTEGKIRHTRDVAENNRIRAAASGGAEIAAARHRYTELFPETRPNPRENTGERRKQVDF